DASNNGESPNTGEGVTEPSLPFLRGWRNEVCFHSSWRTLCGSPVKGVHNGAHAVHGGGQFMMRLEKNDRTIVVGDDDSVTRSFLELTLRNQGYSVELARDGNEVLDYLESKRPVSAVLLDIFMPEKNGFQTLREIRSRDKD